MGLQLEILSWEVQIIIMNTKVFILSCLLSCSLGAPAADAEADPQLLAAPLAAPYHAVAASNCVTEHEVLTTQLCTPSTENVCTTETVETEEIEYEKVCKEVVDTICDAPLAPVAPYAHAIYKREAEAEAEADAEADPQFLAPYALTHAAARGCCCPCSSPCSAHCPRCCPLRDCHREARLQRGHHRACRDHSRGTCCLWSPRGSPCWLSLLDTRLNTRHIVILFILSKISSGVQQG